MKITGMEKEEEIECLESKRYWYILHVKTGYENRVVEGVERYFRKQKNQDIINPFILKEELVYKQANKIIKKVVKPVFSGYVFIDSNLDGEKFLAKIIKYVYKSEDILKILRYGNSGEIALREEERQKYLTLLGDREYIESSIGFIKGDKVYVTSGALVGREGLVKKVNLHKKIAIIELSIMGQVVMVKVGLDIVEKM